jgi:hypothetical protein
MNSFSCDSFVPIWISPTPWEEILINQLEYFDETIDSQFNVLENSSTFRKIVGKIIQKYTF